MRTKILILALLFNLSLCLSWAQRPGIAFERLDVNQVNAMFWNVPNFGWDFESNPQFEVPKGSGLHPNFASGLWIGGMDDQGGLRLAATMYRQGGNDFFSGPYRQGHPQQDGRISNTTFSTGEWHSVTSTHGHVVFYEEGGPCRAYLHKAGQLSIIPLILPVNYSVMSVAPLSDGRMLFFGVDQPAWLGSPVNSVVIDVNGNLNPILGPSLNFNHFGSRGVILPNGKTLISGIFGSELIDPLPLTSAIVSSDSVRVGGSSLFLHSSGKVLQIGGRRGLNPNSNWTGASGSEVLYEFDPITMLWDSIATMPAVRNRCFTMELPDSTVLILGGHLYDSTILAYNVSTHVFDTVGYLPFPLEKTMGAKLPDGRCFVGYEQFTYGNRKGMLIYDPAANQVRILNQKGTAPIYAMGNMMFLNSEGSLVGYLPSHDKIYAEPYQKIWKVSQVDIQDFLQVRGTPAMDPARFRDILTWPAHGMVNLGEDADLAPFVDVNGDGRYEPLLDGDYPCIQGDQMLWWVFHDEGPHTESGANPMGIQIEASAYAYDCSLSNCPDTALDYTVFLHYEVTNKSNRRYGDVKFAAWQDGDIGSFTDDFVGSDPSLDLGFIYNGDDFDETSWGYGLHPPALGTLVLTEQGMDGFQYYENDWSLRGNPDLPSDYYQYLNGLWKDGSPLVELDPIGYSPGSSLPPTRFHFSGDPGFCGGNPSGWYERNPAFDRRYLTTVHVGDLFPGQSETVEYALIWARSMTGDHLTSVCELKNAVPAVKQFWSAIPNPCLSRIVSNEQRAEDGFLVDIYPNPARGDVRFEASRPLSGGVFRIVDLQGRVVQDGMISDGMSSGAICLEAIPAGLYFLQVSDEEGISSQKITVLK